MQGRFTDNRAYVEYESLLKELHRLIADGQGDSVEADRVRELMDAPERQLNRWEINRLNGLSADLYMLQHDEVLEKPPVAQNQTELHAQIQEYEHWNDWDSVLALLRRRPPFISDEAVAFTRARAYGSLGHHDTALLFFEFAMKQRPAMSDYRAMHLFMLRRARRIEEASKLGAQYASAPGVAPVVLIADALNRFEISGASEAQAILTLLSRAFKAIGPQHPTLISYVVLAYILAARCLMLIDRTADAVAALDEALRLRPGDVAIQEARDVLISSQSTDAAEAFERISAKLVSGLYNEQGRTVTTAHTVWGKAA
jgi:tetratricopeptide (TPR) repeat protein